MDILKSQLYQHCLDYVDELIHNAEKGLAQAQHDANQEEKSSAGDKFETHRAMMHLQMESFIKRLSVAEALQRTLYTLSLTHKYKVSLGALVETDRGHYFIGVSAPALTLEGITYTFLSPEAPLYKILEGKREGDWVEWLLRGEETLIEIISVI
jgi:hypothetical protein